MPSVAQLNPAPMNSGIAPWEKERCLQWLQSLRAVSVILVMLHHLRSAWGVYFTRPETLDFLYFGHCGVDIFFVISGFIMWHVYRRDLHCPERFISFVQRRYIRIYPVYWILTTALLAVILVAPDEVKAYKRNAFYLLENYSLLPLGYAQGNPPIPAAWSLFHEIKFYLLFGACILLPPAASRWWVRGWVAVTLLNMVWLVTPEGRQTGLGFWASPYNLQFLAGCLVAHLVSTRPMSRLWAWLAALIGSGGIAYFGYLDSQLALEDHYIRALAYSGPAVLLVWAATTFDHLPALRQRASRFLAFVGDASYVLYLIHYPVYCFGALLLLKLGLASRLPAAVILSGLFLVAFGVSVMFHLVVEKPLTARLKRLMT